MAINLRVMQVTRNHVIWRPDCQIRKSAPTWKSGQIQSVLCLLCHKSQS